MGFHWGGGGAYIRILSDRKGEADRLTFAVFVNKTIRIRIFISGKLKKKLSKLQGSPWR